VPPPPSLPVPFEDPISEVVSLADVCDLVAKIAPVSNVACRRRWDVVGNASATAVQALA